MSELFGAGTGLLVLIGVLAGALLIVRGIAAIERRNVEPPTMPAPETWGAGWQAGAPIAPVTDQALSPRDE